MAKGTAQARKNSKDGTLVDIYINVQHCGKSNYRKSGVRMPAAMWDKSAKRPKRVYRDYQVIKERLEYLEDRWYKIYVELGGDFVDVDFKDMLRIWDKTYTDFNVDSSVSIDRSRMMLPLFQEFISNLGPDGLNRSLSSIARYKYLERSLRGYMKHVGRLMTVEELNEKTEFIKFGRWMETERIIIDSDGSEKSMNSLGDTSINMYMKSFKVFYNYRIEEKGESLKNHKNSIINSLWPINENIGGITDDLFHAIMDTQIDYDEKPRARILLDNIKLILGHGFRYSDLWMLTKDSLSIDIDGNKSMIYRDAKTAYTKKDVKLIEVPLYPAAEKIIDFYKDKDTSSRLNFIQAATALKDFKVAPHLKTVNDFSRATGFEHIKYDYIVNPNPIVPVYSAVIEPLWKKKVYTYVQKTWLKNKFGNDWKSHVNEKIGFMAIVTKERCRTQTEKLLYETLQFHFGRHTFCSRMANNPNVSVADVRDCVGHTSIATTNKYIHTDPSERKARIRAAYAKESSQEIHIKKAN